MSFTFTEHTATGTQVTFPFSFAGRDKGYIKASDIIVEQFTSTGWVTITNWSLSGTNQVTFLSAPAAGVKLRIRRVVDKDQPYAEFSRGVALDMSSLNNSFIHILEVTQELLDGFYPEGYFIKQDINLGGNKLTNMGSGVNPTDGVNKSQLDAVDKKHTDWNNKQDTQIAALIAGVATGLSRAAITPIGVTDGTLTVDLGVDGIFYEITLDGLMQPPSAYTRLGSVITFSEPLPACTVAGFVTIK